MYTPQCARPIIIKKLYESEPLLLVFNELKRKNCGKFSKCKSKQSILYICFLNIEPLIYGNLLLIGNWRSWSVVLLKLNEVIQCILIPHCRKYPTISSYFGVTLPIFGTNVPQKICLINPKNYLEVVCQLQNGRNTKLMLLGINDPIIGSKNLLKINRFQGQHNSEYLIQ